MVVNAPSRSDLEAWASALDARARLPELVRRLIHATVADLDPIECPSREGVQKHGPDGEVCARSGTSFVPAGRFIWELSTQHDVGHKAILDYNKRPAALGVAARELAFVFVTLRSWPGRAEWERERAGEGAFRGVRAV